MTSLVSKPVTLICTINYPANSGYAWSFIERLCGQIATEVAQDGVTTYVAYPAIPEAPTELAGTPAKPVVLDFAGRGVRGVLVLVRHVRRLNSPIFYISDREAYSWRYLVLRLAGAKWLVVHVHATGAAVIPSGPRRWLKAIRARLHWWGPDVLITVSDFVARRASAGALVPKDRVVRVWNGIPVADPERDARHRHEVRLELGIDPNDIVIFMASRAAKEKGVDVLLRAFDELVGKVQAPIAKRLRLVFVGGGVDFDELKSLCDALRARSQITLTGPVDDSRRYLAIADIVAVPSVCLDALPLGVLEAMAHGKPVVGSEIGGIPEMVRDGREGLLVPPGNQRALTDALARLVEDAPLRHSLGENALARSKTEFAPDKMIRAIASQLRRGWQGDAAATLSQGKHQ